VKIALVANNIFENLGGYEKVVSLVLKSLAVSYKCDISIFSFPHYRSLFRKAILEEFRDFKILRASDYRNPIHYALHVYLRRLRNADLLINAHSIEQAFNELANKDIVLVTDPMLLNTMSYLNNKFRDRAKLIYWDHGALFGYFLERRLLYSKEIIKGIQSIKSFLAISTEIRDFIKNLNPEAEIELVFNPLSPYAGRLIKRPLFPQFLYVGRLADHHKNIVFLINGLAKLKDRPWKLKIIGTGDDEIKLKSLSKKLGLTDRIEWLGVQKDPYENLQEVTALLLTSRCEGLPTVLLEAIQRGIPVISSDCKSGPKDIIVPGKNGYLYKEGDMEEFTRVLRQVIEGDLGFDSSENIAKTADKFRDLDVIYKIFSFLLKETKRQV